MKKMFVDGIIGKDAEIVQKTNSKEKFIVFSIAVDESYKDAKTGEKIKRTDWIDCILNYDRYKNVVEYLKKSAYVVVIGKPSIHLWNDDKGESFTKFRVVVNDLSFYNKKPVVIDSETGEVVKD